MIRQRGCSYTHRRECNLQGRTTTTTPGTKLPQETCYPMMHTASAVPLTPCIYYTCSCQSLPHRKIFPSNISTPPSSAFLSFLPLSTFHPAFQKLQKSSNTDKAKEEGWLNLTGNRWVGTGTGFCFSGPRRRLTCRIITRRYIRSRKEKAWP